MPTTLPLVKKSPFVSAIEQARFYVLMELLNVKRLRRSKKTSLLRLVAENTSSFHLFPRLSRSPEGEGEDSLLPKLCES